MEIKTRIQKPFTESERINFIVENNHNLGYTIEETETELRALGYTDEEQAQKERERLDMLSLTAADVERAIYKVKGMDFEDIVEYIRESQSVNRESGDTEIDQGQTDSIDDNNGKDDSRLTIHESRKNKDDLQVTTHEINLKALKIELKANNFYRGNPYIEQVGAILGFTPNMLDEFFETGDWKKLLPEEEVEDV